MPRFFFDTDDTVRFVTDEHGCELPHVGAAKLLASKALCEMMADKPDIGDATRCRALVRDEAGTELFAAHLTLVMGSAE